MSKALLYAQRIRPEQDLHQELLEGVRQISLAVASTLGPAGCNVIIDAAGETPSITKDGVTVARHINVTDPVHNAAVKMIQAVARAHELETGDGTTTATVLAHHIFEAGLRMVARGINPAALQRSITAAVAGVVQRIEAMKQTATDEQIAQVATIATNGDVQFGSLVAEAIAKVGREGTITLDDAGRDRPETWLEVIEGFQMQAGWMRQEFCTDHERGIAVLENPYILITERQLTQGISQIPSLHDLGPLFNFCAGFSTKENGGQKRDARPLLIVADDVLEGSDAMQYTLLNHMKKNIQVCIVRAPGIGEWRRTGLADLALATGGRVLTRDGGDVLSRWVFDKHGSQSDANLGKAKRVVVTNSRMIVEGPAGDAADRGLVGRFAESLKKQATDAEDPKEREHLLQRASRLTGSVAVLHVGAPTDTEKKALRALAEDAVLAVRAALSEGIVPGGGLCLFLIAHQVGRQMSDYYEQIKPGAEVLVEAMRAPLLQIAANAGEDPDVIAEQVARFATHLEDINEGRLGFNAAERRFEDLIAAGIVDPAKVVRVALEKASSIAGMLLTTSCLVYFDPDAVKPQPLMQLPLPMAIPGR